MTLSWHVVSGRDIIEQLKHSCALANFRQDTPGRPILSREVAEDDGRTEVKIPVDPSGRLNKPWRWGSLSQAREKEIK